MCQSASLTAVIPFSIVDTLQHGFPNLARSEGKECSVVALQGASFRSMMTCDHHQRPSWCIDLEAQIGLAQPSTEVPRLSPLMIQSFVDELEGGGGSVNGIGPTNLHYTLLEEGQTAVPPGFRMKRAASQGTVDDDEVAGPSWMVVGKDDTPPARVSSSSSGKKGSFCSVWCFSYRSQ
ncbi:hypothetical protein Esti_001023 [Eimeria stiedai]